LREGLRVEREGEREGGIVYSAYGSSSRDDGY
jgi:hypothetical protein